MVLTLASDQFKVRGLCVCRCTWWTWITIDGVNTLIVVGAGGIAIMCVDLVKHRQTIHKTKTPIRKAIMALNACLPNAGRPLLRQLAL